VIDARSTRRVWIGQATGVALALSARLHQARSQGAAKARVLLVTGGHGFEVEPFFRIFSENPEIQFTAAKHTQAADVYDREDLLTYDVVVLYDMPKVITDSQKEKFLALLKKGTGLVMLHHALVSYPNWPEYAAIVGGRYLQADEKTGKAGYQHDVDIPVQIAAKDHPITSGLKDFTIHDEIYWGFQVDPKAQPLLTTTQEKSGNPLAWTMPRENGRTVYVQLGHGPSAYDHPTYREIVARCIRWAAQR
jgi:type 1 glutamine amidotransferase